MPPINPLIFLAVTLMGVIGFSILLFVGLRMWNEERAAKSGETGSAPGGADNQEAAKGPGVGLFAARPGRPAGKDTSAHDVLRVLRDNWTGRLIIEVGGKRFQSLAEIQDPVLQQAVQTTVRDLHEFTGTTALPGAAPQAPVSPIAAPGFTTPPPGAHAPSAPAVAPAARPPPPAAPASASNPPPIVKPSMNPFKQRKILREIEKRPVVPLKTIPEHIDEFLQQKLMGTPYIWRGIRVRAGVKGEVIFELDGSGYGSVDEVPDEEVRALIRAALAEWEKTR